VVEQDELALRAADAGASRSADEQAEAPVFKPDADGWKTIPTGDRCCGQ